ncbi:elongator complex protein 3 [Patescibacteria group bacterium]
MKDTYTSVIKDISALSNASQEEVLEVMQKYHDDENNPLSKSKILFAYNKLKDNDEIKLSKDSEKVFFKNIRKKKIRTISGVTPVTVLTKPFPCPGKCIFCPNDVRMPKSYLADEPGAQRAEKNMFDPYFQTYNRLVAYNNIGHPTGKVELIVLGGTWSHYPEEYQIWFIKRCFEAMNDFDKDKSPKGLEVKIKSPLNEDLLREIKGESMKETYNQVIAKALIKKTNEENDETATWEELNKSQKTNEKSKSRCVGLVLETRPDEINKEELIRIRKLGGTKIQIGIQSLNDEVLELNKRGHDSETTRDAINLIREAGFKIHIHWMPNLYGSDPEKDVEDFKKLFSDISIKPDELKVYPCSLIESAELMQYFKDGRWKPYTEEELNHVLVEVFKNIPRYCRITRVIRDIPSTDIVEGNKKTNFRQITERNLEKENIRSKDIRAREVRGKNVNLKDLELKITEYETTVSNEYFIEYVTEDDLIAGFLRLSLPKNKVFINEIQNSAMIREVHVYGQSMEIGDTKEGKAQHIGLGKSLMEKAEEISKKEGFKEISVISSIGTREYYAKNGYSKVLKDNLYQHKKLKS